MRPDIRSTAKILLIALALSSVVILLALGIESVIRELVVIPLSYLSWLIQSFSQSLPQDILWAVVILFILSVAIRSLNWRRLLPKNKPSPGSKSAVRWINKSVISAANWLYRMRLVALRQYSHPYFIQTLINVLIDVEAFKYQATPREIKERIKAGSLNLPDDIQEYLLRYETYVPSKPTARLREWLKNLAAALFNRLPKPAVRAVEEPEERLIEFMEKELEIYHVHRDE